MEITSKYLTENEDILKFVNGVSGKTGEKMMNLWIEHVRKNRELFRKTGWAADHLQSKERGKSAIIIGASPALSRQLDILRDIQKDNDFVLCGISSNLDYLLKNGIKPKYVIVVDADKSTGDDWNNIDMDETKEITLIANTHAYPPMLERWKGPLYFLGLDTGDKRFERKHHKWFGPNNGNGNGFPSITAQFNIMAALAFLMLECPILLFIGHELSFESDESQYYVDRPDDRDDEPRFAHGDIYRKKVYTTLSLLAVKYALEGFLEVISNAGYFFNCTEAGIFGVTKKFGDWYIPWIEQFTLKNGIAQAKQIMRTGHPFYEGDLGGINGGFWRNLPSV